MSTILPLPSSPHWAPTTTTAPIASVLCTRRSALVCVCAQAARELLGLALQCLAPAVGPQQPGLARVQEQHDIVAPGAREGEVSLGVARLQRRDGAALRAQHGAELIDALLIAAGDREPGAGVGAVAAACGAQRPLQVAEVERE